MPCFKGSLNLVSVTVHFLFIQVFSYWQSTPIFYTALYLLFKKQIYKVLSKGFVVGSNEERIQKLASRIWVFTSSQKVEEGVYCTKDKVKHNLCSVAHIEYLVNYSENMCLLKINERKMIVFAKSKSHRRT